MSSPEPLNTSERGAQSTFTVALDSDPTANVTIALSSSKEQEGTVLPKSLTFTPQNGRAPQIVTVTGVDDSVSDGVVAFEVVLAPAASNDPRFAGVDAADVAFTNTDDDRAGFSVAVAGSLRTAEGGTQAMFTVVANSKPASNVTLPVVSMDTSEGTVSPASLVFTPDNWSSPHVVTITGVDDVDQDGDQEYTIGLGPSTSADVQYTGLLPPGPKIVNADDESPGVVVVGASLHTTEGGGTATFTVALKSRPAAGVTIPVSSGDTTEGTVSPAMLTFTPANWNAPQTVTATGVDDTIDDGNQVYAVVLGAASSTASAYAGLDPADVSITNDDNDSAGITLGAISGHTTEAGGTATFTVVLGSAPTANVTIGLTSSNTGEGTVSPASVTFTTANWSTAQTVTVTGVNDNIDDGNQTFSIVTAAATSSDTTGYSGLDAANVAVINDDNDSAGITVGAISGHTTEAAGTATFTVVLNTAPTANVSIALTSGDTGEGTVAPASLTFTSANWNVAQTATVTGVNDNLDDGNQPFSIVTAAATSSDTAYDGLDAANVSVINDDNDTVGISVSAVSGNTTEGGGFSTLTVVLQTQPSADVTIGLTSSDTGEGTVSPSSLTFTSANWNTPRTVTVTGVNDDIDDGNQTFSMVTAAATSTDAGYSGLDAVDRTVTNNDNDTAGITVSAISGNTTEAGGTATFTIVLVTEPTANVTIGLTSSNTAEGTVAASVIFTAMNWSTPQTVTVTGANELVDDGDVAYSIVTAAAASADTVYAGINAADVSVTNTDDD